MDLSTSPAAAASTNPSTDSNDNNIITFRPRATALVHAEIARRGYMGDSAIWRHARAWALRARFGKAGDVGAWKVHEGEVFTYEHPRTVAARLGVSLGHVWNVMSAMRTAGLIETRRCSPKRMAVVFLIGASSTAQPEPAEGSHEGSHEDSSDPRSDPRFDDLPIGQPEVLVLEGRSTAGLDADQEPQIDLFDDYDSDDNDTTERQVCTIGALAGDRTPVGVAVRESDPAIWTTFYSKPLASKCITKLMAERDALGLTA